MGSHITHRNRKVRRAGADVAAQLYRLGEGDLQFCKSRIIPRANRAYHNSVSPCSSAYLRCPCGGGQTQNHDQCQQQGKYSFSASFHVFYLLICRYFSSAHSAK